MGPSRARQTHSERFLDFVLCFLGGFTPLFWGGLAEAWGGEFFPLSPLPAPARVTPPAMAHGVYQGVDEATSGSGSSSEANVLHVPDQQIAPFSSPGGFPLKGATKGALFYPLEVWGVGTGPGIYS